MSSTGAGYDLSATTFSPDGKIFQVEYATKAVENSGTAIGVRCKDGVLLAVEKLLLSKLLVPGTNKRVHHVTPCIGLAVTGLTADTRQIVNRARDEASNFKDTYGDYISPQLLTDRVSNYVHYFTMHGSLRPFGASALIAGYDAEAKEAQLYLVEPSGVSYRYFGCAVGKGRQGAKTEIEKLKVMEMTCREAMKHIAKILHVLHDDAKDKPFEIEMSWVSAESGYKHAMVPTKDVVEAELWAKAAIEADEMDDGDD